MKDNQLAAFRRKKIGFIFQDYNLIPSLNIWENVVLPVGLDGRKVNRKDVMEILKKIGMENKKDAMPNTLSGGEKQRVAIARALAGNPALILADEPTGNLDSRSGAIVVKALEDINERLGKTIVMVTHDPQVASHCKRIIFLKDGKILKDVRKKGSREEFYLDILKMMKEL